MVHALEEAHRVLKPGGVLVDLRPAPAHRQLGIGAGRTWKLVGSLHEQLDDDYSADAAIAEMIRRGWFEPGKQKRFLLDRVMDNLNELREFLAEFDTRRGIPSHAALIGKLSKRYKRGKLAIRGPMHLATLTKLAPAPRPKGATMILAILRKTSDAEALLNNLSEADFNLDDISVIMQDVAMRDKIAKDTGPLHGVTQGRLTQGLKDAGVPQNLAQRCVDAIKQGKPVVAMKVEAPYEAAARQMFRDIAAEMVE